MNENRKNGGNIIPFSTKSDRDWEAYEKIFREIFQKNDFSLQAQDEIITEMKDFFEILVMDIDLHFKSDWFDTLSFEQKTIATSDIREPVIKFFNEFSGTLLSERLRSEMKHYRAFGSF